MIAESWLQSQRYLACCDGNRYTDTCNSINACTTTSNACTTTSNSLRWRKEVFLDDCKKNPRIHGKLELVCVQWCMAISWERPSRITEIHASWSVRWQYYHKTAVQEHCHTIPLLSTGTSNDPDSTVFAIPITRKHWWLQLNGHLQQHQRFHKRQDHFGPKN